MNEVTKKSLFRLEVVFIVVALASSIQSHRHTPQADEIEQIINKTHSIIWKCSHIECQPGFGLSVQCGSSVSINQSIECIPCKEGETYSDASDHSVCKGCKHCSENQEKSGNCTVVRDYTQCLGCKKGYYRDTISDDCHPCSVCCGNNDRVKECENSGLHPEKRCRETHSDCHQPSPTKPTEKGGQFPKKMGLEILTGNTRNLSPGAIVGIIAGVIVAGVLLIRMLLKKTGHMTHVQTFFQEFLCCHTCNIWSQVHSGRNTVEFHNSRVDDKLLQDVEKGTYAEDGVREGALEKACDPDLCIKSRVKFLRQSSCPDRKVFEPRPDLIIRSHSHPGCPETVNESDQIPIPLDIGHKEGLQSGKQRAQIDSYITKTEHTATAKDSEQEDPLPKCSHSSSIPVTSEELSSTKVYAEQPKVLSAPSSMNQATSTTGLNNSPQMPHIPQDFQEGLMDKKVREIPISFYRRICTCLDVKRDASWDDYRLLGEKIGLGKDECEWLGQNGNPTDAMMRRFDSQRDSCIRKFRAILQEMDRFDAIEIIDNWLRKEWFDHETPNLITF